MKTIEIDKITIPYDKELLLRWKDRDASIVPTFMLDWNGPGTGQRDRNTVLSNDYYAAVQGKISWPQLLLSQNTPFVTIVGRVVRLITRITVV